MQSEKKPKAIPTPLAALLLLLIVTVNVTWSQVNQLTGMATQQVQIASGVTLQYTSDIDNAVKTRNELSTGGWCGLGWKFGFPSISVMHNNTVDLRDDRWFYNDGYGNVMEIVRISRIHFPGKFHFKNSPQKKITVSTDNTTGTGALRIYGWTVTELDGSTMIFGYNPADPTDEIPYLPCWNNTIGKGMGTYTDAPEKFYYRWPLRRIVQPDGQTTQIDYSFITGQTTTGYSYTKEIYPSRVTRPNLSHVEFTLGTKNKDANEGYCEPPLEDFPFMETKFLRGISVFDVDDKKVEQVNLLYSGDPGQVAHIKSTTPGFAERLLTGIMFKRAKGADRLFSYDNEGFLTEGGSPEEGSKTVYEYKEVGNDIYLNTNFNTDFDDGALAGRYVQNVGNHVFVTRNVLDQGTGNLRLEYEVYSKVGFEWQKFNVNQQSGVLSNGDARLYPYNDRFAIHYNRTDGTKGIAVYQWSGSEWKSILWITTDQGLTNPNYRIVHGPDYIVECYKYTSAPLTKVRVFGLDETTNTLQWEELLNVSYVQNLIPWTDFDIAVARDYFVISYFRYAPLTSTRERFIRTYRKNGNTWTEHGSPERIELETQNYDHLDGKLFAYDDFFVATNMVRNMGAVYGMQNIAIRRWDPTSNTFQPEIFENTGMTFGEGGFYWPHQSNVYVGSDYIVLIDTLFQFTPMRSWMMIYRYMKNADGSYSWKRTYIKPSTSCAHPDPKEPRTFPDGNDYDYAKWFRNISGDKIDIDGVYCSDRHFFVTSNSNDGNYIWDFRWEGDDSGPTATEWVSRLQQNNGQGLDYNCQGGGCGLRYEQTVGSSPDPILEVPSAYAFPDFNTVVSLDGGVTYQHVYMYDFENRKYTRLNAISSNSGTPVIDPTKKIFPGYNGRCTLREDGNKQILNIGGRYHDEFHEAEMVKTVRRVHVTDEMGYRVTTSYDCSEGKRLFDPGKGTGIYNFSKAFTSDAGGTALTGKTTVEYCIDSSLGTFGQVYAVSQHRQSEPAQFSDDSVRVNGFLMELDGYTPKVGWVCLGDANSLNTATRVRVDPYTGYFSVKMDNSSGDDFKLYYLETPDNSVYHTVFHVYNSQTTPTAWWMLDYPGNTGDAFQLSEVTAANKEEYHWNNIKINFGFRYPEYKTVWNRIRRPHAIDVTYNFYGTEVINTRELTTLSPRSVRNVKITGGVLRVTATPFESYDENNNLPSVSYTVNSDGMILASKTIFAYEKYRYPMVSWGMDADGAHMLMQPAGKITCSIGPISNIEWETANNTTLSPSGSPFTYALLPSDLSSLTKGDRIYVTIPMVISAGAGTDEITVDLSCNGSSVEHKGITLEGSDYSVCNFNYTVGQNTVTGLQLTISGVDLQTTLHSIRCDVIKRVGIGDVVSDYADRVVSASAVTWEQLPPGGGTYPYRRKDQWVWNVPLDSTTGLPQEMFEEFDYGTPESNTANHWEKKSTVDKYSSFSRPVQVTAAGQPVKTVVHGKNEHIPIAKVTNTTFRECGVFTGDYQCREDETNYWDKENGWEKGTTNPPVLDITDQHFGQKSIIAENDYGALRTFRITPGKGYTLSAWVKAISGTVTLKADALWSTSEDFSDTHAVDGTDTWHLMTVDIPMLFTNGLDVNQEWYVRAWVGGEPGGTGFKAAIDDIRFAPTKALVSSIYYDTLWRQPIVTVDANNNPGIKTVYDEYGRPVEFFRIIDKSDLSTAVRVQSKEYHLMGDGDPPAYSYGYEAGTPDWSDKDGCGVTAIETMGGRSGSFRLVVTKANGCIAYKTLDTPQVPSFENRMCVYRGFYRISSSSNALRVGVYAKTGSGDIGVGSGYLPYAGKWTPFEVYFDMRGIAAGSTNQIEFRFTSENDAAASFDMDDETIQTMY